MRRTTSEPERIAVIERTMAVCPDVVRLWGEKCAEIGHGITGRDATALLDDLEHRYTRTRSLEVRAHIRIACGELRSALGGLTDPATLERAAGNAIAVLQVFAP